MRCGNIIFHKIWPTAITLVVSVLIVLSALISSEVRGDAQVPKGFDRRWLKLLHYQPSFFGGYTSTIDHSGFFFAENGKHDPVAEFRASRRALLLGKPLVPPHKLDPLCAFPARARYFREVFGDDLRSPDCPGIKHWRQSLPIVGVSMVFSTAYSGNPASLFGHTFFKLRVGGKNQGHDSMLDYAASFMASPDGDSGFQYFMNGLTGGYKGIFSIEPFYAHIMNYNHRENRDLWEYDLNLSRREREIFLEHFWELYAAAYVDYYFLDDNCSSLPLEVLEAVRPDWNIVSRKGFFVLPNWTISLIASADQEPLGFYPSARRQFRHSLTTLKSEERRSLNGILTRQEEAEQSNSIPVLDSALAYISLKKSETSAQSQKAIRDLESQVLLRRARLGPKNQQTLALSKPRSRPELGHGPTKIVIAASPKTGSGELRARYGLHDLLDSPDGYEPFYHMNYFDTRFAFSGKTISSWDLRIGEALALIPLSNYRRGLSWKAAGGIRSEDALKKTYIRGGIGGAYSPIQERMLIFSLPTLQLETPSSNDANPQLQASIDINVFAQIRKDWRILLTVTRTVNHTFRPDRTLLTTLVLAQQISLGRNMAIEAISKYIGDKPEPWQHTFGFAHFF